MSAPARPPAPGARTYSRSAGTRAVGVVCAVLFAGAAAFSWTTSGLSPGIIVVSLIALLSLANLMTAWADRFTLGEEGIEYRNLVLERLGRAPRRVAWSDILGVRGSVRAAPGGGAAAPPAAASRALFLIPRSGRRIVLDSLERHEEVLRTVLQRCNPAHDDAAKPD
jgi:energy-converting hydrogenase Eha subunit G